MYHRFVFLANPEAGSASFSWRVKNALENLGHTVFWFTPEKHPFAFEGQGAKPQLDALAKFIGRQKPDCLVVADGLAFGAGQVREAKSLHADMLVGRLLARREDAASAACGLDFVLAGSQGQTGAAFEGGACEAHALSSLPDLGYLRSPLANTVAHPPCILCLQDATPERIQALREIEEAVGDSRLTIRLTGQGWPKEWRVRMAPNGFVYASRSSVAVLRFDDGGDSPDANLLALAKADGAPVIPLGSGGALSSEDLEQAKQSILDIVSKGLPLESRRFAAHAHEAVGTPDGPTLETELEGILDKLAQPAPGRPALKGCGEPRTVTCIMGYFGMGNFGDEYILATLDEHLRADVPGSSIIAVSENPQHTLTVRGIYATKLEDAIAVDRALAYSSAALVVAGLLFDQGIRWTAGKAETFTSARCSNIPGIAAFASMAAANDTPMIFHGVGAGPLDVLDARQLVKLAGRQGAVFTPRDRETGDIIRSCGVNERQVVDCADTIFLNASAPERLPNDGPSPAGAVAISLREYENTPADFPARMAQALDVVADKHPGLEFVFCILDPGDLALSRAVMKLMQHGDRCATYDSEGDLDGLVSRLKNARAGFSMRYHSALVMSAFGVPCAGMDYLPKVRSLYADLGASDILVSPMATADECAAALLSAIEDGETWATVILSHVAPLREKSQRALDILLGQIGSVRSEKAHLIPQEFFLHAKPEPHRKMALMEKRVAELKASTGKKKPAKAKAGTSAAISAIQGDQPLVSIVMPVYNAETHLAECVDSLLGQTYANIELICVDDGSKDESPAILNGYAASDPRVRVISQRNAGPGVARNRGMDEARGEFIYFFDSDDFCDPTLIEAAVSKLLATGADLVSFPFREYDERVGKAVEPAWAATPRDKFDRDVMSWRDNPSWVFQAFHNYPWNKMARLPFIRENNIRFQETYLTEDLMYSLPAVLCAELMSFVDGHYVYHRIGTTTNAMSGKDSRPLDFMAALLALKAYLDERGMYEDLKVSYANWAVGCCKYNLHTLKTLEGFRVVFNELAQGGAAELGLTDVDPGILFNDGYRALLDALKAMTAEEYAYRLYAETLNAHDLTSFRSRADKETAKKNLEAERKKLAKVKKSAEYRFGVKALRIPRAMKNAMKKGK